MNVKTILLTLMIMAMSDLFAQNDSRGQDMGFLRGNINLSLSKHRFQNHFNSFSMGLDFGVNDFIETGIYGAYWTDNLIEKQSPAIVFYGSEGKFHIVQLIKPSFFYVDAYISARMGCMTVIHGEVVGRRTNFDGCINGGIGFNFTRHFGVYYEAGIDNHKLGRYSFGFNIRFGGPKKWQR